MVSSAIQVFSQILGWTYFTAWIISFFPQMVLNYQRKSVEGLSFDFLLFNVTGFVFYAVFNIATFVGELNYKTKSVQINDVAFAVCAICCCSVTISQCLIYDRGNQKLDRRNCVLCVCFWLVAGLGCILAACGVWPWMAPEGSSQISLLVFLGTLKSIITMFKYIPQVWLNHKRRSTIGWSISQVILDLIGGTLSMSQNFLLVATDPDQTLNGPKLLLATVTFVFDGIFISQHYCIYPQGSSQKKADYKRLEHEQENASTDKDKTDGWTSEI